MYPVNIAMYSTGNKDLRISYVWQWIQKGLNRLNKTL